MNVIISPLVWVIFLLTSLKIAEGLLASFVLVVILVSVFSLFLIFKRLLRTFIVFNEIIDKSICRYWFFASWHFLWVSTFPKGSHSKKLIFQSKLKFIAKNFPFLDTFVKFLLVDFPQSSSIEIQFRRVVISSSVIFDTRVWLLTNWSIISVSESVSKALFSQMALFFLRNHQILLAF